MKRLASLLLASALALTAAGCAGQNPAASTQSGPPEAVESGKSSVAYVEELRIGTTAAIDGANVMTENGIFGKLNYNAVVTAPFVVTDENGKVQPFFMTGWELSGDLNTITATFATDQGLTWHDGEPVTMDDVVFTFQYLIDRKSSYCSGLTGVEAVNETTATLTLTDGKGNFYRAEISTATNKRCLVNLLETIPQTPLWSGHLHIAMAPTKNMDRTEWFAEKATEIGFDELTFLNCRFSERKVIKTERIAKILISAIKQSLKARLPQLNEMTDFNKFISQPFNGRKFIAHCYEGDKPLLKDIVRKGEDALVLIGPEGDFSEEEVKKAIENGFEPISLGRSRLRTETAALVACHILNLQNQ